MYLAGETVRRQPLAHRISVEKRAIDFLRSCFENTVESDGVGGHDEF